MQILLCAFLFDYRHNETVFCDKLEYIHRNSFPTNGVSAQQAEGLLIESGDTLTVRVEKSISETPIEGSAYLNTEPTLTVSKSEGTSYNVSLLKRYTHYSDHEMIDLYRFLNTRKEDRHDETS